MKLTFSEQIKIILKRQGKTVQDLANLLNTSLQNINQQLKRDNFKERDMQRIAAALGYDVYIEVTEAGRGENVPIIENKPAVNDPDNIKREPETQREPATRAGNLETLLNMKQREYNNT